MGQQWVSRDAESGHVQFRCSCGWKGADADVEDWDVQDARDRLVRRCPGCNEPVPEWGAIPSIDGATQVARGPLAEALTAAGDDADG